MPEFSLKFLLVLTQLLVLVLPVQASAQVTWAYRSNSTTQAFHANAWKAMVRLKTATAATLTTGPSGTFGGTYLDVNVGGSTAPQISAVGLHNTPIGTSAITVLMRLIPKADGSPAAKKALLYMGNLAGRSDGWYGGLAFNIDSNGRFEVDGGTISSGSNWGNDTEFSVAPTFVQDQPTDLWFVWDGSTSAGAQKLYQAQNGNTPSLIASLTPSAARPSMQLGWVTEIQLNGNMPNGTNYNDHFHINEIVIWDTAEDPTAYGARSTWISAAGTEGYSFTDPGVANVLSTASYTYAGAIQTGTYVAASTANVKTGVTFGAASALTGTYTGDDRWTCPLDSQLSSGVQLKCNSTSLNLTGTRDTVTNTMSNATMSGQRTSATLTAQ